MQRSDDLELRSGARNDRIPSRGNANPFLSFLTCCPALSYEFEPDGNVSNRSIAAFNTEARFSNVPTRS